jgi:hypothetical protein
LVADVLAHEPAEVQRAVIGILSLIKVIAKTSNSSVNDENEVTSPQISQSKGD